MQLLAAQFVDRVGDEPRWRITDAVPYPALRRDELVVIATCQRDGVDDAGLVAIIDTGSESTLPNWTCCPRCAGRCGWTARPASSSRVAPSRVRCYNEGSSE